MLAQEYRDVLIQTIRGVLPAQLDGNNFFNAVRPGFSQTVPGGASYQNTIEFLVATSDGQGWIRDLVERLIAQFPNHSEFNVVLAEIARDATAETVPDPFDEVLLAGNRPFVNRQPLRTALLDLTGSNGFAGAPHRRRAKNRQDVFVLLHQSHRAEEELHR